MRCKIMHICAMLKVLGFQCLSTKELLVSYTMKSINDDVHIMLFSINN